MEGKIFTREDLVQHPKAAILITHGLGEHCSRYDKWVYDLNRADISVFRYDLPGHGRSRADKWLFQDFDDLTSELDNQYGKLRDYSSEHGVPLFLFGHSLGGLITADYVIKYQPQVTGVVLSAPALDVGEVVKPWMIRVAGWARRIVPGLPVQQVPPEYISRDTRVVEDYKEDPLVFHGKIRINTGYELLDRMEEVNKRVLEFNLPVLMVQGQADKIVRPEVAKMFFDQLQVEDKTWHSYAEMYHEVLNDVGNKKVKEDILNWLERRLS